MRMISLAFAVALGLISSSATAFSPWSIFFECESASISGEGHRVLSQVAGSFRNARIQRLRIVGHADRTGTPAVNRQMARERAEAVKLALVRLGVPAERIVVESAGDSRPVVETPRDVGNERNRRVEIIAIRM